MVDARVWLPESPAVYDGLPGGIAVDVYDGDSEPPASISEVEFYVPPYMAGVHTLEVIRQMSKLRVVQTLTAGVENVKPYLPDGVLLCNARGVHDASTAELGVGLILAALRGFPDFVRSQDRGEWRLNDRRQSLADKQVLIVGYGSIGEALERRLLPNECSVVRVARRARPDAGVHGVDELPALLPQADVVVMLLPNTTETKGMVDAKFLASMKEGALFVNIARGPIVDTDALVAELGRRRILAALDVTDPEPLPAGHPLWTAPGVLISPHVGGNTSAFVPRGRRLVAEQLGRYVAGEPLTNIVTGAY
ncbi:2-hydroxyacid dehydrogenase [Flindersiella endophytica]